MKISEWKLAVHVGHVSRTNYGKRDLNTTFLLIHDESLNDLVNLPHSSQRMESRRSMRIQQRPELSPQSRGRQGSS